MLTKAMMQWFFDAYVPDVTRRKEPTVSPLQASLEADTPPAREAVCVAIEELRAALAQ